MMHILDHGLWFQPPRATRPALLGGRPAAQAAVAHEGVCMLGAHHEAAEQLKVVSRRDLTHAQIGRDVTQPVCQRAHAACHVAMHLGARGGRRGRCVGARGELRRHPTPPGSAAVARAVLVLGREQPLLHRGRPEAQRLEARGYMRAQRGGGRTAVARMQLPPHLAHKLRGGQELLLRGPPG
eukprot:scaffold115714_cov63-Phaeocystis_antarctica.AAC.1